MHYLFFGLLIVWIRGIIAAIKTQAYYFDVGRFTLHLLFWGGFVAAIIYALKIKANKKLLDADHDNPNLEEEEMLQTMKMNETIHKQQEKILSEPPKEMKQNNETQ